MIAGSPETVRQRMEEMIKDLRVGHVFCLLHVGDMPKEKTCYSTKLFADKVMPHLERILPDYDDDDRFWCKPLAKRVAPGRRHRAELRPMSETRVTASMSPDGRRTSAYFEAGEGPPLVFLHGAGGLAEDKSFLAALGRVPCFRAVAAGLRRFRGWRRAARHARFHAAYVGRDRRARARGPYPGRPFDGRHDRRRDGGGGAARCLAAWR